MFNKGCAIPYDGTSNWEMFIRNDFKLNVFSSTFPQRALLFTILVVALMLLFTMSAVACCDLFTILAVSLCLLCQLVRVQAFVYIRFCLLCQLL
jgi:hypothetical protein